VLARQPAQVALAGKAPELAEAPVAVDSGPQPLRALQLGQVRVTRVDRFELEPVFEAREVEVVLLVELGDEAVSALAVRVELLR
jgi:ABC-type amino acid transport substrate-binding protein